MANLSNINNKFLVTTGGNVLIGKTAANNATVGTQIMSTGDINPTVNGDTVARFNRLGTDGEIIRFQHDTSTDGAINSSSGRIAIGSSTTGIFFDSIRDVVTPHNMSTNAYSSTISLGRSAIPFKDLYLSGSSVFVDGAAYSSAASIRQQSNSLIFSGGSNGYYFNKSDNSATHIRITSSGNVGINCTPSYKLQWSDGTRTGLLDTNIGAVVIGSVSNDALAFYTNLTEKMRILGNGNVGIGFTTPSVKLDVRLSGTTGRVAEFHNSVGYGIGFTVQSDGGVNTINSESNQALAFATNGASERMRITNAGKVGIGTTSPTSRLSISGLQAAIDITRGNSGDSKWEFSSDSTGLYFSEMSTGTRAYMMTIKETTGNVGIGTTSPGAKLEVVEATANTDVILRLKATRDAYLQFAPANTVKWGLIADYPDLGDFTTYNYPNNFNAIICKDNKDITTNLSGGNFGIGTTSPSGKLNVEAPGNHLHLRAGTAATGKYWNFDVTANNQLYIITDGNNGINITNTGDVGIGTVTNTARLNVGGKVKITDDLIMAQTNGRIDYDNGVSSGALRFHSTSGNAERMRVTSAGNVGIGTADGPGDVNAKLHVYKQAGDNTVNELLRLDCGENNHNVGKGGAIVFRDINVYTDTAKIIAQRIGNTGGSTLQFSLRGGEKMRIKSDGNVGIGTTSPTYKLHVASSNNVSIFEDTSNASGAAFIVFNRPGVFSMGSITRNGSANSVSYNTGSDYRLKEDLKDFNALDLVNNITAYDYKWKDIEQRDYGFIAHELKQTLPNVVTGEKDGEKMQGVDYSKLTPILLKAIQELEARVKELENK